MTYVQIFIHQPFCYRLCRFLMIFNMLKNLEVRFSNLSKILELNQSQKSMRCVAIVTIEKSVSFVVVLLSFLCHKLKWLT